MPSFVLDSLNATLEQQEQVTQPEEREREESLPPADQITGGVADPGSVNYEGHIPASSATSSESRQRTRSDSQSTPTERKAKYARLTEDACNVYQLRGTLRQEVQDFSSMNLYAQNIVTFAAVQSIRQDLAARDAEGFTFSAEFKERSHLMLRVLLFAPTTMAYVGDSLKRFLKGELRAHFSDWKVLKSTVDKPDALTKLIRTFSNKLTADRNAIKDVLNRAVQNNYCINRLMNELVPEELYITDAHRARWAWVLTFYRHHQADEAAKSNSFWGSLDKALLELEEVIREQTEDPPARALRRRQVFEGALAKHRLSYPTQVAARSAYDDAADWQLGLEARVSRHHSYGDASFIANH